MTMNQDDSTAPLVLPDSFYRVLIKKARKNMAAQQAQATSADQQKPA
jgi:hypothetical protein